MLHTKKIRCSRSQNWEGRGGSGFKYSWIQELKQWRHRSLSLSVVLSIFPPLLHLSAQVLSAARPVQADKGRLSPGGSHDDEEKDDLALTMR